MYWVKLDLIKLLKPYNVIDLGQHLDHGLLSVISNKATATN